MAVGVATALAATVGTPVVSANSTTPAVVRPQTTDSVPSLVAAQVTARAQGSRVEVGELRSETSTTWVNPDGTLTTEQHQAPIRFKDAHGAWRDVDLSLGEAGDGSVMARGHIAGLSIAGGLKGALGGLRGASGTDLVGVDERPGKDRAARQVIVGWPGLLGKPVLSGVRATYGTARPGTSVIMESRRTGYEILVQVRDAASLPLPNLDGSYSWSFPMRTKGLTGKVEADGSVSFRDAAGEVVSQFAPPVAWDAQVDPQTGDRPAQVPVTASLAQQGAGRGTLTLTVPGSWMRDPARVWPVTVDPTYASGTSTATVDTYVSKQFPTQTNSTSTELRVGTYNGGTDVARSFLTFPISSAGITGKTIESATLKLYETHSWSCTAKPVYVYNALGTNASTNWSNQPAGGTSYGSASFAKGYSSSCADAWVSIPVTSLVKWWATTTSSAGGIRLTASETDNYGWKKFASLETSYDPVISFTYNRKPNQGSAPKITGGVTYTPPGGTAAVYTADTTPELTAVATDPDGNTYRATIEVHTSTTTTTSTLKATCNSAYVASGVTAKCTVAAGSALTNNGTYYARAAIVDDQGQWNGTWSPWTTVRIGATAPPQASMTCQPPFTDSSWSYTIPASISCTVTANGTGWSAPSAVLVYDNGALINTVAITPPTGGGSSTGNFSYVPRKGGHHLTVTARNPAGISSTTPGTYELGFGEATLQVPVDKAIANGVVNVSATLKVPAFTGTLESHLQYRLPKDVGQTNGWVNDTAPLATNPPSGVVTTTGTWNLGAITAAQLPGVSATESTVFQVRVCVHTTTDPACIAWTTPNTITRPAYGAGGVSDGAGGAGTVDLSTGIFSTGATDVAVPGLSIGRTYDTLDPAGTAADTSKGVFGPGWSSTLDGGPDGLTGWTVEDNVATQGHFLLTSPDQSTVYAFGYPQGASGLYFASNTATHTDFTANSDDVVDAGGSLALDRVIPTPPASEGPATLTFTASDGTKTTWTGIVNANGTATASPSWVPVQVIDPDPGAGSLHAYPAAQPGKIGTLVSAPAGKTCTAAAWSSAQEGCTRLDITYAASTTATATTPGDFAGQVQAITTQVWDTDTNAFTPTTTVASYLYDSQGQLVAVTDSRTTLVTRYAYTSTLGRLSTLTEPGRAPYRIWYDSAGKVSSVSRDTATVGTQWSSATAATLPSGSTYLARYVYSVSPAGNGTALPNLSTGGVAPWFQGADAQGNPTAPSYGFAVFGPSYPTASALPSAATDPNWHYAQLTYTAGDYTPVNTAAYGAGRWLLTATDYNPDGSRARTLDQTAIAAIQDHVTAGAPFSRGQVDDLSSQTFYVPETLATTATTVGQHSIAIGDVIIPGGTLVADTFGPKHDAVVNGDTNQGIRTHTQYTYDTGAPNSGLNPGTGQAYGLVTEQRTSARSAGNTDPAQNVDVSTLSRTVNGYAALAGDTVTGWDMGAPTTVTTKDPAGTAPDITRTTRYDAAGRVVETRQPSATTTADAGTRVTTYYAATANGACPARPEWAERVCSEGPGAGALPTTTYTYNTWGGVATAKEGVGGTLLRQTTATYDAAGRPATTVVTASVAGSTAQPGVTYGYSTVTGEQTTTTQAGTSTKITTGTDGWGRPSTYQNDALEITTTTYGPAGYPDTVSNLTGTTTYTFDSTTPATEEHRGLPTKLTVTRGGNAGLLTYTGEYNAAGQLTRQSMPGATAQVSEYDNIGQLTNLTYTGQVTPVTESTDANGDTVWTPGTPQPDQPWLSWTRTYDALGRVAQEYNGEGAAFDGVPGVTDPTEITAPSVGQATAADKSYTYDYAGRLTQVTDRTATSTGDTMTPDAPPSADVPCTVRTYAFDTNGNRTGSTTRRDPGGDCTATVQTAAKTYTYNAADQPTAAADGTNYTYDPLGRQTMLPAADAPNPSAGNITLTYYDADLVRSISQAGTTTSYTLDVAGRRTQSTTGSTSTVRHYADGSDNPGWTSDSTGSRTRYTPSLSGQGAIVGQDGASKLMLANPHGDNVTTVSIPSGQPEQTAVGGIDAWKSFDEYGQSASSYDPGIGYGYLGQEQREAAADSAGLALMGSRVYSSMRGAFTSRDPVFGGNATAYSYPTDPVNMSDTSGQWCWKCALVNGIAFGLQLLLGRLACASLTGLYLLCSGLVSGVLAMVKYLIMETWALGHRFTGHMLAVAAGLGVLGFMSGIFGGMVKMGDLWKMVKPLMFRLRPAIYQAARVAAQFVRDRGMYMLAQAMYQIPGAIIPRLV